MLLLAALHAFAGSVPLPQHAEAGPLEGFVSVWVDPDAFISGLKPAEPGTAPASEHTHPAEPGGMAVLALDEGVALEEILAAIEGDEALVSAQLNGEKTAVLVNHPDLVALLARPLGKGTLGDAVSLYPVPRGILRMPGPRKGPPTVDLPVENVSSARAVVSIDGVEVGEVGPYATAIVHGVPPGTYALSFRLPNGYVRKALAKTDVGLAYEAPYRMR